MESRVNGFSQIVNAAYELRVPSFKIGTLVRESIYHARMAERHLRIIVRSTNKH
jgi:hypothetical protein